MLNGFNNDKEGFNNLMEYAKRTDSMSLDFETVYVSYRNAERRKRLLQKQEGYEAEMLADYQETVRDAMPNCFD